MKRGSHPVCTVPGVLSAIASDICYLLKTSGFTIRSWKNRKNQSPRWRGVRGQRVQPGLPSRNTHRLTSMHFLSFWKELMSCFYLHQKRPTPRKAFFFLCSDRSFTTAYLWNQLGLTGKFSCPLQRFSLVSAPVTEAGEKCIHFHHVLLTFFTTWCASSILLNYICRCLKSRVQLRVMQRDTQRTITLKINPGFLLKWQTSPCIYTCLHASLTSCQNSKNLHKDGTKTLKQVNFCMQQPVTWVNLDVRKGIVPFLDPSCSQDHSLNSPMPI